MKKMLLIFLSVIVILGLIGFFIYLDLRAAKQQKVSETVPGGQEALLLGTWNLQQDAPVLGDTITFTEENGVYRYSSIQQEDERTITQNGTWTFSGSNLRLVILKERYTSGMRRPYVIQETFWLRMHSII